MSRDLVHAGALAALALVLYALGCCPTVFAGDSAELAAAAALLGVPHPPGYPLYTLVTGALVRLLPWFEPAAAANLASGIYAASGAFAAFLLARSLGLPRAAATVPALLLAVGSTYWSQALVAEVYTFDVLLLFTAACALLAAARTGARANWILAGLALGLWLGHRPVNVIYLPACAALVAHAGGFARTRRRPLALLAGLALALLPFAYLPLASLRDPALDVGDPERFERLAVVLSSGPYLRHLRGGSTELALGRLWRWFESLPREVGIGALLAWPGAAALARPGGQARWLALALAWIVAADVLFSVRYNVLDVEVFFLPSFAALALFAGFGADWLFRLCRRHRPRSVGALGAGLALAAAVPGLAWNGGANDRSDNRLTRRLGEDLFASVPDEALLFVDGDTTIHALWYLQAVERRAPGVVVVSLGHLADWHLEQLVRRHPDAGWPSLEDLVAASDPARAILESVGRERPAFASLSVDRASLLASPPGGGRYGTMIRGLAWEILREGDTRAASEYADFNARFFEAALQRLELPGSIDMDSQSIVLQYALALAENARFQERLGRGASARAAWEAVLRLEPDRREREVRDDVRRGLGLEIPRLELGAQAARRLREL